MAAAQDLIARAIAELFTRRTIHFGDRAATVACLVRAEDWRPLEAPWWCGKEVSIVGVDLSGNFFLRHSDGSVRYWDHAAQEAVVVAPSISEFVRRLE